MTHRSTVLVVEDDELSAFMMAELLSTFGIDVETSENGFDCLEKLNSSPDRFDLILMDIHMPEMTGDQTTVHIRSMPADPPSNVPVVAVTADPIWSNEENRLRVGLDGYLPKPVAAQDLAHVCERYGVQVIRPI